MTVPPFLERLPQVLSIATGACGALAAAAWQRSHALSIVLICAAVACLGFRLWIPVERRRKKDG